ncbi:hypothetical protein EXIGLDRAFT_752515 [Exidia glandulosa HHB12029]|uniref:GEgh 16 protein n=1 Tax=Exidia glandulosa HHB12029 TaxID=1314781 RepID=A0A165EI90_EXIGL|nr:hypothetical protein EXIGLDRAFT_752515 [Exidia glandulosa HHB12029]
MRLSTSAVFVSLLLPVALGHGVITNVQGANGNTGAAFGVIASTPRDGSRPNPFEQDTSIIRDREAASGKATACGRTKAGGVNDIESNVAAASDAGLPSADENGQVTMTLHQVNQDGAGPYTCDVSTDATGNDFQEMDVVTNVPGFLSLSGATAEDFPLVAQMPAGATCTGGPDGNACIVRCRNKAIAGPFGGCVAVTTGDSAAASGNSTASTTAAETASATATAADSTETAAADEPSDAEVAAAEKAEAESDGDATDEDTATAATANPTKAAKATKAAGKGGLSDILGKFGLGARDTDDCAEERKRKRMIKSRIAAREHVGVWV